MEFKECPNCGFMPLHIKVVTYAHTKQIIEKCALCEYHHSEVEGINGYRYKTENRDTKI